MKEEWKNIAGSTWIKVVLAAIIVIPMLYSGIFLGSMWDPYGNADKIPVAVVNEDNKVTYNGSSLHIGEDLVANLKKAKEEKIMHYLHGAELEYRKKLKEITIQQILSDV